MQNKYKSLNVGDVTRSGDEVWDLDKCKWVPLLCFGVTILSKAGGNLYRRKAEEEYRTLKAGESTIATDEVLWVAAGIWIPVRVVGHMVSGEEVGVSRRKVEEYKSLNVGDVTRTTDEIWNSVNGWVPVVYPGITITTKTDGEFFRRKVEEKDRTLKVGEVLWIKKESKTEPKSTPKRWALLPNGNIAYLGQNVTIPISKENIVDVLNGHKVEL